MSAPVARTLSGIIAFTVAAVPTGMKAGVRISPRGIDSVPRRALPSVAWTSNLTVLVICSSGRAAPGAIYEANARRKGEGRDMDGAEGTPLIRPSTDQHPLYDAICD